MPANRNVLAFVMAGGEGSRLHPLTANRCKPAVPFNGKHRIVDFVLSNLVNSEIYSTYLLVQYKSQSLIEHVRQTWTMARFMPQHFITVVPPQMRHGPAWFQGTADAVYQNIHLIESMQPDIVAVFGADHIYRMDVRQMIDFHIKSNAHASVATIPVDLRECDQFGIVEVDDSHRIKDFKEKPRAAQPMPGSRTQALASMGNYIFNADVLLRQLKRMHDNGETDFGKHILPSMVKSHRLVAYDFDTNHIPGTEPYEEHGYWRDVGTVQAYWDAHMDLLGESPLFDLDNRWWPIRTGQHPGPPARFIGGDVDNAHIGEASLIKRATIRNSILGRSVWVNEGAVVEDSIVMDHTTVGKGARLKRTVVDRFNIIPADSEIGVDPVIDRRRHYVDPSGIVVVPRGGRREFLLGLEEF